MLTRKHLNAPAVRPIRCALLAPDAHGWFMEFLFACPGIELYSMSEEVLGLKDPSNPFGLPPIDRPDLVLVSADWVRRLNTRPDSSSDTVFSRIRSRCAGIVGIDGHDAFGLWMPPNGLEQCDLLLKAQGIYRDRDLYNYKVGSFYPGTDWTGKSRRLPHSFTPACLDKIRLSAPCFLAITPPIRARVRARKIRMGIAQRSLRRAGDFASTVEASVLRALTRPRATAHCLVSLTHISRLDLLVSLRESGVSGDIGVASLTPHIWGTERLDALAGAEELEGLRSRIERHGLFRAPLSRYQFRRSIAAHKTVLAPPGYGELTLRHGDALDQGRALVCPDLSHIEIMFRFEDGRNVLFCRPDFSDVIPLLASVEEGRTDYQSIASRGRADWESWTKDVDGLLRYGILDHLREVLSSTAKGPDESP